MRELTVISKNIDNIIDDLQSQISNYKAFISDVSSNANYDNAHIIEVWKKTVIELEFARSMLIKANG